jgi:Protein of unknown function (DUF3540)
MASPELSARADIVQTLESKPIAGHQIARVIGVDDDGAAVGVELSGMQRQAIVAVSCLVRPLPGDRVLLYCDAERTYVLNVLEREGANWGVVTLPGRGNLSLEGETVAIAARQRMSLRADSIDLQAKMFAVLAERGTWIGKLYTLIADRLRSSAQVQETAADSLTVKAVDRFAIVDRVDSVQAEMQSTVISGVATETAHSKVISVTEDVRIDGKRVLVA